MVVVGDGGLFWVVWYILISFAREREMQMMWDAKILQIFFLPHLRDHLSINIDGSYEYGGGGVHICEWIFLTFSYVSEQRDTDR